MLQKLVINNYAIIDHLSLAPDKHLNIVTGETGAGKSIILGALSLILGERADTSVLINKEEKCIVEAHFEVADNTAFRQAMQQADLDDDTSCIIRREINTAGKSRAFINDTPVTLSTLNKLTGMLVDLHQQFDNLALRDDDFQMDVVDALADNIALRKEYREQYAQYKKIIASITELKVEQTQWQKEADYKQFLLEELTTASFKTDEIEQAEQELKQLSNAERILGVLQAAGHALVEGEQPLINELKRVTQQLQGISELVPEVATVNERLQSVWAELKDISNELSAIEGNISLDEGKLNQLQERIDLGYKLLKKHALQNTNELLSLQAQLEEELKASLNLNENIAKLEAELQAIYKQVADKAQQLSARRKEAAPQIEERINNLLGPVGMPNARIKIAVNPLSEPGIFGTDDVQFMLDANKSGQYLPVYKAASGGEMSRIMLCIKSQTAKAMHLPTLIFDEVDTGISGEAAKQVGVLLRNLAAYHQVICITHQPQVAAKANSHFYVYKEEGKDGKINTRVRILQPDERILAIARMIDGEKPSDAAMQNAKELVVA